MTKILIRKATKEDATVAVPLIIEAIGDIAMQMTGEQEKSHINEEFIQLFQRTDNRHSYLYTYIAELDGSIAGVLVFYSDAQAKLLDANLEKYLTEKVGQPIKIDKETLPGEWYIDTVVVDPSHRGLGIGTKLIHFAEKLTREFGGEKLSLNVELQKNEAIRLYNRLGFDNVIPWTIIGEPFHHMVKEIH